MNRKRFLQSFGTAALGTLVAPTLDGANVAPDLRPFRQDDPERFWGAVRAQYRFDAGLIYFNTGGLGPAPQLVLAEAEKVTRALQSSVETGRARFEPARATLAQFFGAKPNEIAFVRNATEANGIIAAGLQLKAGDEVIFESHAHPGGSFPWLDQQEQRGLHVITFDPDAATPGEIVARVEALLTARTRVLQVSHVTAPTGIVMPVAELARLCHARGIWFHVDGAQSAGMFPFRLSDIGCDSYATSGHKWLGAPHETGLLWIREDRLSEVHSPIMGAHSAEYGEGLHELAPVTSAARFEYGTRNAAAVVALAAAAEWHERVGRARIAARGRQLVAQLRAGLTALPNVEVLTPVRPELSGSILTFRSPRLAFDRLFSRLFAEHRLRCRPVSEVNLNAVRVSCHLFNTPQEIERLIQAVAQVLRTA